MNNMRRIVQKYFIPHAENNYHPHILHTKRAIFYSLVFLGCKAIIVMFVLALPVAVFTSSDILSQETAKLTQLTNELRINRGDSVLNYSDKLVNSATAKALDMGNKSYFSHISPTGKTVADFVRQTGYKYRVVGENLAVGYATAEDILFAWKKSPTHLANLVDKDYLDLGVDLELGNYKGESMVFAVQHFAAPALAVAGGQTVEPAAKATSSKTVKSTSVLAVVPKPQVVTTTAVLSEKVAAPLVGVPFWKNPLQKYLHAKELPAFSGLFGWSRDIYLFSLVFFSLALALAVFIEIKKQHPHIILQTCSLIGLLAVLFWI